MKKFVLVALFAVAGFGLVFATSTNGQFKVSGSVAEVFSLVVPGDFTNGSISSTQETTWSIGNVVVNSNFSNWTIALSSQNGGSLANVNDGNVKIAYTATLGNLLNGVSLSGAQTSQPQGKTPRGGTTLALSLKIQAAQSDAQYQAGSYSDTITVTLTHN